MRLPVPRSSKGKVLPSTAVLEVLDRNTINISWIVVYPWKANDLLFSFAVEQEKNILLGIADSPQTGHADIYTGKSLKFENWIPRGGVLSSVFSSIIRNGPFRTG